MPLTERVTRLPPKGTEGVGDGERATQGLAELVERIVLVMMADGEAFLLREMEAYICIYNWKIPSKLTPWLHPFPRSTFYFIHQMDV